VKYAWIEAQQKRHRFNVDAMCESLNVNRSGYYAHKNAPLSAHKNEDKHLSALIVKSFNESNHTYGTERIQGDLQELMKKTGLVCKTIKKFKATTNANHNERISPNLLKRNFKVEAPNTVWVGDMTYIWTDAGWFYLATVIDLFSRKVVGWSMANHMRTSLINDAMKRQFGSENRPKG
jgi:putative transposase